MLVTEHGFCLFEIDRIERPVEARDDQRLIVRLLQQGACFVCVTRDQEAFHLAFDPVEVCHAASVAPTARLV